MRGEISRCCWQSRVEDRELTCEVGYELSDQSMETHKAGEFSLDRAEVFVWLPLSGVGGAERPKTQNFPAFEAGDQIYPSAQVCS